MADFGYSGAYGASPSAFKSLTLDQLRTRVPSAFAEQASSLTSESYGFVPSHPLIEHMFSEGWKATTAFESRTSIDEKRGYTKHSIRFVQPDLKVPNVGDTYASQTLTNSHDGSSTFQFRGGVHVVVCQNGLVRVVSQEDIVRIRHSGDVIAKLREAAPKMLAATKAVSDDIADFAVIDLSPKEQRLFAEAAAELRWQPEESDTEPGVVISTVPVNYERLLVPMHREDTSKLWGVLNVVQEHLIKGQDQGRAATGRRLTTRAVTSVDKDIAINVGLWNLAAGMRDYKRSA